MTTPIDDRTEPPTRGDERATLIGFLEFQRQTLAWKCAGLSLEQLRTRGVPPSTMSLLGIVLHLADVERSWFQRRLANIDVAPMFWSDADPDGDFEAADRIDADEAFAIWHRECGRSREILDAVGSLDVTFHSREGVPSVRWLLSHMIEEYARHNGHADLLRERLDGVTGE
jgi:uncharacterized damage-inducible protein DinB